MEEVDRVHKKRVWNSLQKSIDAILLPHIEDRDLYKVNMTQELKEEMYRADRHKIAYRR